MRVINPQPVERENQWINGRGNRIVGKLRRYVEVCDELRSRKKSKFQNLETTKQNQCYSGMHPTTKQKHKSVVDIGKRVNDDRLKEIPTISISKCLDCFLMYDSFVLSTQRFRLQLSHSTFYHHNPICLELYMGKKC